jgi:methylthioribulose-1-phosphate dehydratase
MSTIVGQSDIHSAIEAVICAGRHAAEHGWVAATSGNFSVRSADRIAITKTGHDKGHLREADIAVVSLSAPAGDDLSAEAALHFARYLADPRVGAVFHVHMPLAAILGRRYLQQGHFILHGWELQKALGAPSHLSEVRVPVLPNDQDIPSLATAAESALAETSEAGRAPGYVIAGHGIYVWGDTPGAAQRYLEAFDALFNLHFYWSERFL